ncbi:unnamed protein product, partial [Oppiella nova]
MDFNGKVALITGSSSGIGEGIALKLSSLGANVVITGRDDQRIQSVVKKCESLSKQKALGVRADLQVDNDIKNLVNKTVKEFGKINILVNNAGVVQMAQFGDPGYLLAFDTVMNTNVRSIQVLTQLVVPYLESTKGNIINISSVAALIPAPQAIAYCMAKSALDMFTKCLALQFGPKGIRTCRDTYPLQRIGEPEDVAEAVVFLASPTSASFITGLIMPVDGGSLRAPALKGDYQKHYWAKLGIKGPTPIVGFGNVLTKFIWEKTEVEVYWISKYGKLYGLYDGNQPVLSVGDPKLLKDVLVRDFHIFDDRINNRFSHPLLSHDINVAVGNEWKRQRSVISPIFTSGKMRRMYPLIRECVTELLDVMQTYAATGLEVDMKRLFSNYTID